MTNRAEFLRQLEEADVDLGEMTWRRHKTFDEEDRSKWDYVFHLSVMRRSTKIRMTQQMVISAEAIHHGEGQVVLDRAEGMVLMAALRALKEQK